MDKSSITAINLSKQAKTRLFFLKYGMGASSVTKIEGEKVELEWQ
jgi:hypothetical protein